MTPAAEPTGGAWLQADTDAAALRAISDPLVDLVVWPRQSPACLNRWLADLPESEVPVGRVHCAPPDLPAALHASIRPRALRGPMWRLFVADMARLCLAFQRASGCERIDLRLDRIDDDGCAAFHRDNVGLRLLTTYRGPGTEWVTADDGHRALAQQGAYAGPIHRAPPRTVLLFRGRQAEKTAGLVHRSRPTRGRSQAGWCSV